MFGKPFRVKLAHLLLPAIALGIFYTVFGAIPQYRELRRISTETHDRATAVEQLRLRLATLEADRPHSVGASDLASVASGVERVEAAPASPSAASPSADLLGSERSFAQSFAHVLAVFESHAVQCTAAVSENVGEGKGAVTQRVSLIGSFGNVLAAMERIESQIPHALAAGLSMRRSDPSSPCQWEITFRFNEGTE